MIRLQNLYVKALRTNLEDIPGSTLFLPQSVLMQVELQYSSCRLWKFEVTNLYKRSAASTND